MGSSQGDREPLEVPETAPTASYSEADFSTTTPPKISRASQGAAIGLGLLCLMAYFGAELYVIGHPAFPLDDSWIHLQFASRLAAGDGLAYNPGEWVTGSTAPLWTALLALGMMLPPPFFLLWPKMLGALALIMTAIGVAHLCRELDASPLTSKLAALLTVSSHWLLWSALSGMEITLFMALATWGLVLHVRAKKAATAPASDTKSCSFAPATALLAFSMLARPEGALLLVLSLIERNVHRRGGHGRRDDRAEIQLELRLAPSLRRDIAIAAIILGPTLLFYQGVGGSPFPTTLAAKTRPDLLPSLRYLLSVIDIFVTSQPLFTLLAAAGAVRCWLRGPPGAALPGLWLVGQGLAYSLLASPLGPQPLGNFGRYYFPQLPVLIALGLIALEPLLARAWLSFGQRRLPLGAAAVAVVVTVQLATLLPGPLRYVQTLSNVEDSDVRAALWLRPRLPDDALLAVQDVGALKFFLPNRVLDLAGLISPELTPILTATPAATDDGNTYWETRLVRFLETRRPDYLVVFSNSYPQIARATPGFERVASFRVERNVTMAGSELVILSTPWTDQTLKPVDDDAPTVTRTR